MFSCHIVDFCWFCNIKSTKIANLASDIKKMLCFPDSPVSSYYSETNIGISAQYKCYGGKSKKRLTKNVPIPQLRGNGNLKAKEKEDGRYGRSPFQS